ncbi:MAG: hypothetical protein UX17_C0006G0015 [Parcubacteria group bacterium GW2011_GWC2_45_7]|nr:MAG: hypothetical protein UX17_C0006G0015 [Parcubacteria group bacterium GW2011_GWC2_45_7]
MFRILKTNLKGELLKLRSRHRITMDSSWEIRLLPSSKSYIKEGRFEEAEKMYKKAIESDHNQDWAYIELGRLYRGMERLEEAEEMFRKALEVNPDQEAHLALGGCYLRQGRWKEAEEMYKKAIDIKPTPKAYAQLGEVYIAQGKYDTAFESMCRGLELRSEGLEAGDFSGYLEFLFLVARAYELQSKYDSDYLLKALERAVEKNPGLKGEKEFMEYVSFFKSKESREQNIDRWLRHDLEKIVELCQQNNIKLVIQNYPYPFALANKALRDVAVRHSLPFVDNLSVFDALAAKHGMEKYFINDNHCTIEGHKVMAQNVYKVLISEGIVLE